VEDWSKYKPLVFQYKGKWIENWFSNMLPSPIVFEKITFPTVEHFYQAMKSNVISEVQTIMRAKTPQEAKRMGRKVREPFQYSIGKSGLDTIEEVRLAVMRLALSKKFLIPEWREKLLNTGGEMIIEWNNWGDRFWGVDVKDCKGKNHLGLLLMEIREEIRNKKLK